MQQYKAKENGLLLLNPVTNGQFLTFLYYIKRLKIFAEVAYNNPFTINFIYWGKNTENRAMYDSIDINVMLV